MQVAGCSIAHKCARAPGTQTAWPRLYLPNKPDDNLRNLRYASASFLLPPRSRFAAELGATGPDFVPLEG